MTDSTSAFISELIRAANEVPRLSMMERGRLLSRAAATIRDYREQIAFSETPANDSGPGEVAFDLAAMGRTPDVFTAKEVSAAMLHGADTIRTLRILLGIRQEIEDEA